MWEVDWKVFSRLIFSYFPFSERECDCIKFLRASLSPKGISVGFYILVILQSPNNLVSTPTQILLCHHYIFVICQQPLAWQTNPPRIRMAPGDVQNNVVFSISVDLQKHSSKYWIGDRVIKYTWFSARVYLTSYFLVLMVWPLRIFFPRRINVYRN